MMASDSEERMVAAEIERKRAVSRKFAREVSEVDQNLAVLRQRRGELVEAAKHCAEEILKFEVVRNNRHLALAAMKQHMNLEYSTVEELDKGVAELRGKLATVDTDTRQKMQADIARLEAQRTSVLIFQNHADRIMFDLETDRRDALALLAEKEAKEKAAKEVDASEQAQAAHKADLDAHHQRLRKELTELRAKYRELTGRDLAEEDEEEGGWQQQRWRGSGQRERGATGGGGDRDQPSSSSSSSSYALALQRGHARHASRDATLTPEDASPAHRRHSSAEQQAYGQQGRSEHVQWRSPFPRAPHAPSGPSSAAGTPRVPRKQPQATTPSQGTRYPGPPRNALFYV